MGRKQWIKVCLVLGVLAAAAVWGPASHAALNAYLKVTGAVQGEIKGSVTQAGREDSIEVNEFHHLVRNEGGRAGHEPIVLTVPIDKATPLLYKALDTNESLEMTIRFWQPGPAGTEVQFYTVDLFNARLSAIEPIMRDNKSPENLQFKERVRLRATYQSIRFTIEDGGFTHQMTNSSAP